ncbi:hypothetical protein [Streptomyces sp. NPDC003952]
MSNLHGDVALALPLDAAKPPTAMSAYEYGRVRAGSPATHYQWLGSAERSSETLGGTMLMRGRRISLGVRSSGERAFVMGDLCHSIRNGRS